MQMQFCRFSLTSFPIQFRFCKPFFTNVMKNPRQPSFNVKMLIYLPFLEFPHQRLDDSIGLAFSASLTTEWHHIMVGQLV